MTEIFPSVPLDQKNYFVCIMASYLFAYVYFKVFATGRFSGSYWIKLRHLYIIGVSHLFLLTCFDARSVLQVYIPLIFTFVATKQRNFFENHIMMPLTVFVFLIIHLSIHHLVRQMRYYNVYTLDITAPLMMLVIKLSSFAFTVYDQENNPSFEFLEFLGYSLNFPGLLAGPCVSFDDYKRFVKGETLKEMRQPEKGRKRVALIKFALGLFFMIVYLLGRDILKPEKAIEPEFIRLSFWRQWIYIHLTNLCWRSKYYFAWLNAEAAYAMMGLGFYVDLNYKPRWNRIVNVKPSVVEFSADPRQIVSDWNITTNQWLRGCVYKRLEFHQRKGLGKAGFRISLATYVVSALWHVIDSLLGFLSRILFLFCFNGSGNNTLETNLSEAKMAFFPKIQANNSIHSCIHLNQLCNFSFHIAGIWTFTQILPELLLYTSHFHRCCHTIAKSIRL